jgi:hypothetical protein
LATVTASDTQLTVLIPASSFVPNNTPVSVSVMNRADMSSGTTSFTLFVPEIAVFTQLDTQYMNPSAGVATFTLYQSKSISASGITYSTTPSLATLQASGITYTASGNNLLFSVAPGTIITSPGQSITVFGTNGAGVSVQTSFTVYAGNSPSLTGPPGAPLFLDTTTAKTITVTNIGGAVETWITPTNFPTGVSFLSNTFYVYNIAVAVDSIFGSTDITVTGKNNFLLTGASTTFSVTGNKKPVVTTPGTQNLDTTSGAQSFIVYQTSGGTDIIWSITKGDLTAVPGSITLTDKMDTSVTVNIAQTTSLTATNVIVTATNAVDAGNTGSFSVAAFYYVAPIVNAIANFPIIDTTSASTFVTATLSNSGNTSGLAGPVSWSIVSAPAGISINSSSGDISIAQGTVIITGNSVTVRATNAAGTGDATFNVAANVKPVISLETGDYFNVNTLIAGRHELLSVAATSGTAITWSYQLITGELLEGKKYSPTGADQTGSPIFYPDQYTSPVIRYKISLNYKSILDGGSQGSYATIRVTATNAGGSTSIDVRGMAYPYIITNWTSSTFPNGFFYMDAPYKASNPGKHWLHGTPFGAYLRLGMTTINQTNSPDFTYNYRLNRILSNYSGYQGWALAGQNISIGRNYFQNTALTNYSGYPSTNIAANPQWITWEFYFYRIPPDTTVYGVWYCNAYGDTQLLDVGGDGGDYTIMYPLGYSNGDFVGNQRIVNRIYTT